MIFEDDGPSISTTGTEPTLTVDETVLATNDTKSFAANFSSAFGADGAGTLTYALGVVAGGSGLTDTATGEAVNLSLNGTAWSKAARPPPTAGVHGQRRRQLAMSRSTRSARWCIPTRPIRMIRRR